MIRLTHRARCTCGWERSCDAEAQAEVEGEAHLVGKPIPKAPWSDPQIHQVVIEKVRTWEEESDAT